MASRECRAIPCRQARGLGHLFAIRIRQASASQRWSASSTSSAVSASCTRIPSASASPWPSSTKTMSILTGSGGGPMITTQTAPSVIAIEDPCLTSAASNANRQSIGAVTYADGATGLRRAPRFNSPIKPSVQPSPKKAAVAQQLWAFPATMLTVGHAHESVRVGVSRPRGIAVHRAIPNVCRRHSRGCRSAQ